MKTKILLLVSIIFSAQKANAGFRDEPREITKGIVEYVEPEDYSSLALTSRQFREIISRKRIEKFAEAFLANMASTAKHAATINRFIQMPSFFKAKLENYIKNNNKLFRNKLYKFLFVLTQSLPSNPSELFFVPISRSSENIDKQLNRIDFFIKAFGIDINYTPESEPQTIAQKIMGRHNPHIINFAIEKWGIKKDWEAIFLPLIYGNLDIFKIFIQQFSEEIKKPIKAIINENYFPFLHYIIGFDGNDKILEFLLESGANPNQKIPFLKYHENDFKQKIGKTEDILPVDYLILNSYDKDTESLKRRIKMFHLLKKYGADVGEITEQDIRDAGKERNENLFNKLRKINIE